VFSALICTRADLAAELGGTLLWRSGVERQVVDHQEEALLVAMAARPQLVVVDRDLPGAGRLVTGLREDPLTRQLSIVVVARGDFDPAEVELLEAGANAILRIPAGPEWNDRLQRLIDVPLRRNARFFVSFRVAAAHGPGPAEPALALNLSVAGILIEATTRLTVWDEVELTFTLPALPQEVHAQGRVVRLAGPRQYGIEIVAFADDGLPAVRRYLATLDAS
jgi:DNA-binding response OmpR family regulator